MPSAESAEGEPSLAERINRGGVLGALRLASLARLAATSDEPGASTEIKRVNDNLRQEYRQIIADLARYDRMRSFHGASEFGAAALGQLGGGMLSPESWIGLGAKGANWLLRAGKAGLQQGITNVITDPMVQGLNIKAGAQDQYDPWRTAIASGTGFVGGATAKSLAEGLIHLGGRTHAGVDGLSKAWSNRPPPVLPEFVPRGKTSGIFWSPAGDFPLTSGFEGPASSMQRGSRGFDIVTRSHVEGHAAASMRQQGLTEGVLHINNPVICESCRKLLPRMREPCVGCRTYGQA